MKIFTGQKLGNWHKVYGIWIGGVFIGLSISAPPQGIKDE